MSNLCLISSGENLKVRSKSTSLNGSLILDTVQVLSKEDVVFQSVILDPGLLGDVCHTALEM